MTTVIKAENISKLYRLGNVSADTLRDDALKLWAKIKGKEDPTILLAETNDRTQKKSSGYVWALKDINFEVKKGDVFGIIGRNGAGKSTLLKILSKVTAPTTGSIGIKGRLASLLEVGTGFHPELTGNENIYLNGHIMGMTKREIDRKYDEIVDFAGVEKYLETPVKRYSSGMYVRLAFAVAAHLEPEIMIVDEVLAVGDAEFQKKCLGKMKDTSKNEGRTILFVSHNMNALLALCNSGIYLRDGNILQTGGIGELINSYMKDSNQTQSKVSFVNEYRGDEVARLLEARLIDKNLNDIIVADINQKIGIEFIYELKDSSDKRIPNVIFYNSKGDCAFSSSADENILDATTGVYKAIVWVPGNLLNQDTYVVRVALSTMETVTVHFDVPGCITFDVIENINNRTNQYKGAIPGVMRPKLDWEVGLTKV